MKPSLMEGPRGHGYAILVPLVSEKLRQGSLDLAQEALVHLAPGEQLPGIAPELPNGWGTAEFLDTVKRNWTCDELGVVQELLEHMGGMPFLDLLYKAGHGPARKVPARAVARIKSWKTNVMVENSVPDRGDEGPDGLPSEWPLPLPNTKVSTGELLEKWLKRCAWVISEQNNIKGHDLKDLWVKTGTRSGWDTSFAPAGAHLLDVFQGAHWKQAIRLANDLAKGSIGLAEPPKNPLLPLLEGTGVVVCVDPDDGTQPGYVDGKGRLTSTLATARVYSTVGEARKSITAQSMKLEHVTFLEVGLQVKGPAPDTVPQGHLGKQVTSWIKRQELGDLIGDNEQHDRKAPRM